MVPSSFVILAKLVPYLIREPESRPVFIPTLWILPIKSGLE